MNVTEWERRYADHELMWSASCAPAVLYTPEQVAGLLEGFAIDKARRVHRPVTTNHGVVAAIDNLVRAVRRCAV